MTRTKLALAVALAVPGVVALAVRYTATPSTPSMRTAAAAPAWTIAAPFHTELGGELVQPGSEITTGVTLPLGAYVVGVETVGSAAALLDVESISTTATDDGEMWLSVTALSHAAFAVRFGAELAYGVGSGSGAP